MRRSDSLAVLEAVGLFLAAVLAAALPRVGFFPNNLAWFVVGLSILKLSDVWLPRGDAIGMSSALALGALLLFDARFVLIALVVAELIALIPKGREAKWRTALGSLAAESAATVACSGVLLAVGLHPQTGVLTESDVRLAPEQYLYILFVGLLFAVLEYSLLQAEMAVRDGRPLWPSLLGSFSYGGWLIAAQSSAGVLAGLMYRTMGAWGLLVSVVMILVMRQSFVLLLDIRQAYDATIGVLVKAMEAQSPGREGVAALNADLAVRTGRSLGMHGRELERVRYAALLLGLGSDDTAPSTHIVSQTPSHIIEDVEFLSDVMPILDVCEEPRSTVGKTRVDLSCSYLVMAVAAATQTVPKDRLDELAKRVSPRIVREVDSAVKSALESHSATVESSSAGLPTG